MTGKLQPLDEKFPIVGPDGRPTLYFTRWAQQRMQDIGVAITAAQARAITNEIINSYTLVAGTGITIVPDGKLSSNPTISADIQALLNLISTTRGAVLYRGAAAWQALAPGTAGQFLKTNGAGADPEWATGGGGGGLTLISQFVATGGETTFSFTGIPNTYQSLRLVTFGRSSQAANDVGISLQLNADTGNNYDWRQIFNASGLVAGTGTEARVVQIAGAFVPAGIFDGGIIEFPAYQSTAGAKSGVWQCSNSEGGNYRTLTGNFRWRNTAAINQIDVLLAGGGFEAGSSFTLYGY